MKELKVEVPQGYEAVLDQETNTLKIVPKEEEEDKITYDSIKTRAVFYTIDLDEVVEDYSDETEGDTPPIGAFKNKSTAEAVIALAQLEWLRDEYIKRYYTEKPDWININIVKYCIDVAKGSISEYSYTNIQKFLAFPTYQIRDRFFEEQRDLIEQAKPLL